MKHTILQYHTGTLYNQKHAVRFKRSTTPLCPLPGCHQFDSALHMLSGCENHIISSMKTEGHNVAGRMIMRVLSKSPWGTGLVDTDMGSDDRLGHKHGTSQRNNVANRVRQPYQLNANQRHVHLIEIKYCEDTRPGQQLEAAQRQHADICKIISGKAVTLHTFLLGVGGTCYTEHTLYQL
eukprot:1148838-Pelagomonas_calceolata.AAC.1